jgi:alginate O-acetyltransferase complex protein AlgI
MLFNSAVFIFFAATVFTLYAALRTPRARASLLLIASYLFYANWDYRYLPLLLLSTLVDFTAAKRISRAAPGARRRVWLLASLLTNLGLLGIFKYGNFFLDNLTPLFPVLSDGMPKLPGEIPIGISFYTFQTLSYTIDCYRGKFQPCTSRLQFALYVAFFPQLVAGPIVRPNELLPQIRSLAGLRAPNVAEGFQRFVLGLFKKVVIADNVALFVDAVFASPDNHGSLTLWCGAYAFALQIYCDFSAYTDMALGLARAFGIRLPENFDSPYISASITEFWRRWHMSLSRWLRDYLYISLGGNRGTRWGTYRNLMLTMLLGGLWHGAGWTFVLWGAFHGGLLAFERALGVGPDASQSAGASLHRALRTVLTFHLVCLGWVLFRAPDLAATSTYVSRMFTTAPTWDSATELGMAWSAALLALVVFQRVAPHVEWRRIWDGLHPSLQGAGLAALMVLVSLFRVDEVAFIYFQF